MPRACITLEVDCSVCAQITSDVCPAEINLSVGLNPSDQVYVWVRDRFQNLYYDLVTVALDGSVTIDPANFPMGFFIIAETGYNIFITTDIGGADVLYLTISTQTYTCINLSIQ